jgi:ABC-type polysaccharide/polyol phosphate export permease
MATVGSVLGIAWAVVQPLLLLGAYWFLLSVLEAKRLGSGDTHEQVVVLLCGLVAWLFVARSTSTSLDALTRHKGLVKQTNFPVGVLPFVGVGVQAVDYLVGLLLIVTLAATAGLLSWSLLLLLPVAFVQFAFLVGVASLLAPLGVMVRDLRRLTQVSLRAGLFLTPVLYLPSALPDNAMAIAYANPAAYFVGLIRYAVTDNSEALMFGPATDFAVVCGFAAAVVAVAYASRARTWRMSIDHV